MALFKLGRQKRIAPTRAIEIGHIRDSLVSILAVIGYDHEGLGESPLEVTIKSEDSKTLKDIKLSAVATQGLTLTNPGELFGKDWREVRIPKLVGKQAMKFKLGLRAHPSYREGDITFTMDAGLAEDAFENRSFKLKVPVRLVKGIE